MRIWNFICGWPRTNHSLYECSGSRLRRRFQAYSGRTLFAACMTGVFSNAYAAENEQNEAIPDLEFLEFLGQFETDAGEWIEPDSLLTEEFTELLDVSTNIDSVSDSADTNDATSNDQ